MSLKPLTLNKLEGSEWFWLQTQKILGTTIREGGVSWGSSSKNLEKAQHCSDGSRKGRGGEQKAKNRHKNDDEHLAGTSLVGRGGANKMYRAVDRSKGKEQDPWIEYKKESWLSIKKSAWGCGGGGGGGCWVRMRDEIAKLLSLKWKEKTTMQRTNLHDLMKKAEGILTRGPRVRQGAGRGPGNGAGLVRRMGRNATVY